MSFDRDFQLLQTEIEFERRIAGIRDLSAFRRNPTTWELFLLLASARDGFTEGLHEVPNRIGTRYLGPSALLKFIREQRDAGRIRFLEHEKRSKHVLQVDPQLVRRLLELLLWRDRLLAETMNRAAPGAKDTGAAPEAAPPPQTQLRSQTP